MFIKTVFKYQKIQKYFGNRPFKLLDIGCANRNPSKTKRNFQNCEYYGVDIEDNYEKDSDDFKAMTQFYKIDLTSLNFNDIPDNYFDVIVLCHVIEHLYNGDEVIRRLVPKLKEKGIMFFEFPSAKSLNLPSMKVCLNFYDGDTHFRIFSCFELIKIMQEEYCKILEFGKRRNWIYMLLSPLYFLDSIIRYRSLIGPNFWDFLGFADYLVAQKDTMHYKPVIDSKIKNKRDIIHT